MPFLNYTAVPSKYRFKETDGCCRSFPCGRFIGGAVMSLIRRVAVPSESAFPELNPSGGALVVANRADLATLDAWQNAFQSKRKDWRYYEIVEDTICPELAFRYFLIQEVNGRTRAVQPFFLLDQDLLAGLSPRWLAYAVKIRRFWPRFLTMRTLMVGCAAGEAHLQAVNDAAQRRDAAILSAHITRLALEQRASLIVLKEFPARYRSVMSSFLARGFTRVPSMPMTRLDISNYSSFDNYLAKAMSGKTRRDLNRKFRAAEQSGRIQMEVVSDISTAIDEAYPLYLQVYGRSKMRFEKLTKEFFLEISRKMPDKARFFIWRQEGRIIAFSLCLIEDDTLYGEYIGFDYSIALKIHLYFYVMRDMMAWAIAHNCRSIVSSGLGYAPKQQMRHMLEPLDLYVRHTSPLVNALIRRVLPWLEPTRSDETLKLFPNYGELWDPPR